MKNKGMLRFSVIGNVDDGKSTLIGRLLSDSKSIFEDQLLALEETSRRRGERSLNLAFLTDGLRQEREQGITIDVAYRYFSTPVSKFVVADCPGHFEYTRNMVTGTSHADASVIMIDATLGLREQTRRHAFISSMMGIRHLIVCINKMDLMNYDEKIFSDILAQVKSFLSELKIPHVYFIPMSALLGDNVVDASSRMPWYKGRPLLATLEMISTADDELQQEVRLPVQLVHSEKIFSGRLESGSLHIGKGVKFLPTGVERKIVSLGIGTQSLTEVFSGSSVTVTLDEALELKRGQMLVEARNPPQVTRQLTLLLCWLHEQAGKLSQRYLLKHTTREVSCQLRSLRGKLNLQTMVMESAAGNIHHNEIFEATVETDEELFVDSYHYNRSTGSIVLIDPDTHETLAAGLVL